VVADRTGEALVGLIDALTTNYTSFLREPAHFDYLRREALPRWLSRREVRIWCAACATGEEPYTIAFTLADALGAAATPEVRIVASDISTRALETASRGVYASDRFAAAPAGWRKRYLLTGRGAADGYYRVRPEVRERIEFRRINLIEEYSHARPFAAVFCRNVMIYFNRETRQQVLRRLLDWLEPEGCLFVGHSETLAGHDLPLDYVQPALYRKRPAGSGRKGGAR
jgi:chemotaxis protein methyltransferase CheR